MKINVEFDLTPEEFRQALGLPNIEAFQQDLLDRIQRQMESGVEGYDPMSLMQPFLQQPALQQGLSQGLASFGNYQKMMMDMLTQAAQSARSTSSSSGESEQESGSASRSSSTARSSSASRRTGSASARSGSKDKG
ncbi:MULTISPECIES: hypothetical protein [Halomonas]|uniref:hypothetical protein n=1 Tax=Halomonas TaxID=2745 RepID=UPI001C95A53A|nr:MULTISPECIES: hypothetical protein [Halomonas]MED5294312.1 hypothetical protein [Pseudomonadota bacterium]MBY6029315.1 hypothetical protein [Halomonas sp. DP8Y7-1]MBY6208695.1 hypothetical protein [Halomonas sp. DP3Y7-2]MBY6227166.1 hypothetical protein [Halomonas sp. DP3Y7-1]MCA0915085.1 hypothetical protein [Halomonas denitrificans]